MVGVCHVAVGGWYHGGYTLCAAALRTVLWLFFVATCCGGCPGHVRVMQWQLEQLLLQDQLKSCVEGPIAADLSLMIQECGQLQLALTQGKPTTRHLASDRSHGVGLSAFGPTGWISECWWCHGVRPYALLLCTLGS